jgi:hypothetical protein
MLRPVPIEITAIRLSNGHVTHEDVSDVWWRNLNDHHSGCCPVRAMVDWIERGGKAYVPHGTGRCPVWVVEPFAGPKFLRVHDGARLTDDLLALPRR